MKYHIIVLVSAFFFKSILIKLEEFCSHGKTE